MPKKKRYGLNKYQKRAKKVGEFRLRREDILHYLSLAESDDPADRHEAAANLCPCHVRHPVPEIQTVLFKLMEDPDPNVRASAWHTLEDGGVPDDPRMDEIFERAHQNETNKTVLNFMRQVQNEDYARKERTKLKVAARSEYDQTGRCDFCGTTGKVKTNFDTEIPDRGQMRFARVCEHCE